MDENKQRLLIVDDSRVIRVTARKILRDHFETIEAVDGENAWEYYPHNGYYFLDHLYRTLSEHKLVKATTFSEIKTKKIKTHELEKLCAGSWVYGSFSTWIGEKDKNRAWDMLVEAKKVYEEKRDYIEKTHGEAIKLYDRPGTKSSTEKKQ